MDKSSLKIPKIVNLSSFWKTEVCGQTVLPDRSIVNWTKVDGKCQNGQFLQRNQNSESFRLKKIRQDYQNRNKITLTPSSHFWLFLAPETPKKDPKVWNVPVRTYTKMAAIHHGFLFGLAFFHAFSMASKATTTTAMTPGLFCVNKSFGTSTAMRDRRQRRHWQLLSSSCWSSLFLWPCRAFISLYFHDLTWIKRAKRASFTIFKFTKLISFKTQKFKNMNSQ